MKALTQARLKELMHYDPDTGAFTWKVRTSNRINIGDIAGSINDAGYLLIRIDRRIYRSHRLAFLYMTGTFPIHEIDHIDHTYDNNKWLNLREVTHSENSKNQSMRCTNTSGVNGVIWFKRDRNWLANITVDGSSIHLGYFSCITAAAIARKAAEVKYGFHVNHGKVAI